MSKTLHHNLTKKGWNSEEIERVLESMKGYEKRPSIRIMDKLIYWIALFILVFGNFFISLILIPSIIIIGGPFLYVVISVIAFVFGSLYVFLIKELDKLNIEHQIIPWLFIPILAIINIYITIGVIDHLVMILDIERKNNIYLVIVYLVSFIIPYLIQTIKNTRKR